MPVHIRQRQRADTQRHRPHRSAASPPSNHQNPSSPSPAIESAPRRPGGEDPHEISAPTVLAAGQVAALSAMTRASVDRSQTQVRRDLAVGRPDVRSRHRREPRPTATFRPLRRTGLTVGITLRDGEGQRERAPSRRYGRPGGCGIRCSIGYRIGIIGSKGEGDHAVLRASNGAAGDLAVTGKPSGRAGLAHIVPIPRVSGTALPMRTGAVPRSRGRRHPTAGRCGRRCQWPRSCRPG